MLTFGAVSSLFDFVTFGVLLLVLNAGIAEFRTGWFVMSVVSAPLIVLVVRTRRLFFRSQPSRYLFAATLAVVLLTALIPYSSLAPLFQFTELQILFLIFVAATVIVYVLAAELAKHLFYQRLAIDSGR